MLRNFRNRLPALILILGISVSCQGFSIKALQVRADYTSRRLTGKFVRGGAVDSKILRERTDGSDADDDLIRRKGMGAALAATYFTVMASKCALPAVLAQLTSPRLGLQFSSSWTSPHQALFARLLAISTIAIAAGKLLLGPGECAEVAAESPSKLRIVPLDINTIFLRIVFPHFICQSSITLGGFFHSKWRSLF